MGNRQIKIFPDKRQKEKLCPRDEYRPSLEAKKDFCSLDDEYLQNKKNSRDTGLWGRVPACGRDRSENRNYSALSTASTNRQVRSTESIPSRSRVEWISTMSGPKLTASRPGILSISRPHSSPA